MSDTSHRGTIFVEAARLIAREAFDGEQCILRLHAARCAQSATPGSFVHISCDSALPMRRPLSILRANPQGGWIDVLFKVVGQGLRALSLQPVGAKLSVIGPIGRGFTPHRERRRALLVGGGVGIPPMIFLAETLMRSAHLDGWKPLVLMGSEIPFPFRARPTGILVPGIPEGVIASMPLLDEWGVPSRLASFSDFAGCFHGYVTDLAAAWLASLDTNVLRDVEMFSCGPTPMLAAAAKIAQRFGIPCQVSLEEFMACAVGGCAGCAVEVKTPDGPAMRRVCVDGPVFNAADVF